MSDRELIAPEVLAGIDALLEGDTNAPEARRVLMSDKPKVIDFDAWRAERLANEGEPQPPVMFRIGKRNYPLPAEPPATIALDVIRLKEAKGDDASVPISSLAKIGAAMFGEDIFRDILEVNHIGAAEMGDLIIQAFGAWPEANDEEPVPNRETRRARKPSTS